MEGVVKWFNRKKGYGFVKGEDDQEYFVHHSALAEGTFIRDNDTVSFEPVETDKGKQAQNVTLVKKASEKSPEELPEEESGKAPAKKAKKDTEEFGEEPEKEE